MTNPTPIDCAFAAMQVDNTDTIARLRFYESLCDAELILSLKNEPTNETLSPQIFSSEGQNYALIFDSHERLADFAKVTSPYAALPGRVIIEMLEGQNIGLGLNLGVAPSNILLPASAVDWLGNVLSANVREQTAAPQEIFAPTNIPTPLLCSLTKKLNFAIGLADSACLVCVRYSRGDPGYLLAYIDARQEAYAELTQIISDAMAFSGVENETIDVAFFSSSDPICSRLTRAGLFFDLTEPEQPTPAPTAPGMDPDKPPRLT